MRSLLRTTALLCATLFAATVRGQQVDVYLGVATAHDSSNGHSYDTFGDGTLHQTTSLGGVFSNFGFNVFFGPQWGLSWNVAWRAAHEYAGLQYRPKFNTFDAVFQPTKLRLKQVVPEFRAGIGFASVNFDFDDPQACAQVPGCPSTRHFLGNTGGAARWYLGHRVFLRPAVDVQYVQHFDLFGSNWVPRYSLSLGYSFSRD